MPKTNATRTRKAQAPPAPIRTLEEIVAQDGAYSMMNLAELFYALGKRFKSASGCYDAYHLGVLPEELHNAVVRIGREYRIPTAKVLRYLGAEVPSIDNLPMSVEDLPKAV